MTLKNIRKQECRRNLEEYCWFSSEEGNIAAESRTLPAVGAAEMTAKFTLSTGAGNPVSRSPVVNICTLFNKTFINMRKNDEIRRTAHNIYVYIYIATGTNCRQHEVKNYELYIPSLVTDVKMYCCCWRMNTKKKGFVK
jgi:hypothetical protein